MMIQSPLLSTGLVMARLFPSLFVVSSAWSAAAFARTSRKSSFQIFKPKNNKLMIPKLCDQYMGKVSSSLSGSSSLSCTDSDVESPTTTACYDESVLRLLDEDTAKLIDRMVLERSTARWQGNYTIADDLKTKIINFPEIPAGYEIVLQDIPRGSGGGSIWKLLHTRESYDEKMISGPSILHLARAAMGLAVESNNQTQSLERQQYQEEALNTLVDKAKSRLKILLDEIQAMDEIDSIFQVSTKNTIVQSELGGRMASDAALWFALAGSRDRDLFFWLADIASWELQRFGERPSFRKKYALQIIERFAAAGLRKHDKLERIARTCLMEKEETPRGDNETSTENINVCVDGGSDTLNYFDLHSDRSLLLIWKFATRQRKQRAFLRSSKTSWEQYNKREFDARRNMDSKSSNNPKLETTSPSDYWDDVFHDASRPLVVDIGCGMGVSLLGLATTTDQHPCSKESSRLLLGDSLAWSDCNFVGVDLGSLGIEYARGVTNRWSLEGKLHFVIDAAEDFCHYLDSYPGEIRCCMIQFPTPYRLQNKDTGNSQLPSSQVDGFMVTKSLLDSVRSSLHSTKGKLLLQSNCEDVAVWMRHIACQKAGFVAVDDDDKTLQSSSTTIPQRIPQRTLDWIEFGGERADGPGWFKREILHRKGATETEVSCAINGNPVHRCILRVDDKFELHH